jgi:hypothetical protein
MFCNVNMENTNGRLKTPDSKHVMVKPDSMLYFQNSKKEATLSGKS